MTTRIETRVFGLRVRHRVIGVGELAKVFGGIVNDGKNGLCFRWISVDDKRGKDGGYTFAQASRRPLLDRGDPPNITLDGAFILNEKEPRAEWNALGMRVDVSRMRG